MKRYSLVSTALIALFLLTTSAQARSKEDVEMCLNNQLGLLLAGEIGIFKMFVVESIASQIIGPPFRKIRQHRAEKERAERAIATALARALNDNLHHLSRMTLVVTHAPTKKQRSYFVVGKFLYGSRAFNAQSFITNSGCQILNLVIDGVSIKDWIRETEEFKSYINE